MGQQANGTETRADSRINQAIVETADLLNKALAYSPDMQKPAQVAFYRAHINYLAAKRDGRDTTPPKADLANWDVTRCVMAAR